MNEKKPEWWPDNPYPKTVFPMEREAYTDIVPDPKTRTALSGMLGREFWEIASATIWEAVKDEMESIEQLQAEVKTLKEAIRFLTLTSGPQTPQQRECWPMLEQALKGDKE